MNCKDYLDNIVFEIVASHIDMDKTIRSSGVKKQTFNNHIQHTPSDTVSRNDLAGIMHLRESRVKNNLKTSITVGKKDLAGVLHIYKYNENEFIKCFATARNNDLSGALHLQEVTKKPTNIFSNAYKNLTKHFKNPGWLCHKNRAPSGGSWNRL